MKILLACDCKLATSPITAFLQAEGYRVTHVDNGRAALEAYNNMSPDLVLMDVDLPEMGGIEVTRQIKAITSSRWIPIIMIIGLSDEGSIVPSLDAGADEYLVKPVDFDIFLGRLRSIKRITSIQDNLNGILDSVAELRVEIQRMEKQIVDVDDMIIDILDRTCRL
jgi:DNA-binding response OmpR family regulator